jgi:hypothetical protein
MTTYKGYRISRGAKTRFGKQAYVAVRGNLALMEDTEEALRTRVDARERFDAWALGKF